MIGYLLTKKNSRLDSLRHMCVFLFQFIISFTFGQQLRKNNKIDVLSEEPMSSSPWRGATGRANRETDARWEIKMTMHARWARLEVKWHQVGFWEVSRGERQIAACGTLGTPYHLPPTTTCARLIHVVKSNQRESETIPVVMIGSYVSANPLRHWSLGKKESSAFYDHQWLFDLFLWPGSYVHHSSSLLLPQRCILSSKTRYTFPPKHPKHILQSSYTLSDYSFTLHYHHPFSLHDDRLEPSCNSTITFVTTPRLLLLLVRHQPSHLVSQAAATHEGIHGPKPEPSATTPHRSVRPDQAPLCLAFLCLSVSKVVPGPKVNASP